MIVGRLGCEEEKFVLAIQSPPRLFEYHPDKYSHRRNVQFPLFVPETAQGHLNGAEI